MSSTGFVVGSKEECARIQILRPEAHVLVLTFPLFAPDPSRYIGGKSKSKTNQLPISDLGIDDFEFKYQEQLEAFFDSCDSILALAPNDSDGRQWLAHASRMGKLLVSPGIDFSCGLYTYLGDTAITKSSVASPDQATLDTDFYKYVFSYIAAAWFRNYVLVPFHRSVAHIGKGAVSLGGYYVLLVIASIENRYHIDISSQVVGTTARAHVTVPIQMETTGAGSTRVTQPILPELSTETTTVVNEESIANLLLPDALEFCDAANDYYADVWALMQEQPSTFSKHVRSGNVAIVTQDPVFLAQLREAIHDMRLLLTSYGLKLHETESQQLSYVNAIAGSATFPLVVSSSSSDDSDLLLAHLREQMFRAYFVPDPSRHAKLLNTAPFVDVPANVHSSAIAIECQDGTNDYLSLIGTYGFVTNENRSVACPTTAVKHDPKWIAALLATLAELGIRGSYVLYLLRSLQRRKMLCRVGERIELTSYGYAYAMSLLQFVAGIADAWSEAHAQFKEDIERTSDRRRVTSLALQKILSIVKSLNASKKFELQKKRIKKHGSDKKITWTLHLDNKEHIAYWTTRSGKRRAVWYKVTGCATSTEHASHMLDTALDMFPKKRHVFLIPRSCGSCGSPLAKLSDANTGILSITCTNCGATAKYTSIPIVKEFENGKN